MPREFHVLLTHVFFSGKCLILFRNADCWVFIRQQKQLDPVGVQNASAVSFNFFFHRVEPAKYSLLT